MPKIYKRNCDNCNKYYESSAKRFCCCKCSTEFKRGRERVKTGLTRKKLFDLFISQKKSISEITEELNLSRKVVITRLKWFGIKAEERPKNSNTKKRHLFEKGSAWKGGIKHRKNSYNAVLKPNHPRANKDGYVQEHILVWEKHYKKELPKGWVIHHLNGIKNDNHIENLLAMIQKKHNSWLVMHAQARRIKELENRLKKN